MSAAARGVVAVGPEPLDGDGCATGTVAPHDVKDGGRCCTHTAPPCLHLGRDVRPRGQVQCSVPEAVPVVFRNQKCPWGDSAVERCTSGMDVPHAIHVATCGRAIQDRVITVSALLACVAQTVKMPTLCSGKRHQIHCNNWCVCVCVFATLGTWHHFKRTKTTGCESPLHSFVCECHAGKLVLIIVAVIK